LGDSQFHFLGTARDVDSVYLGVYRAEGYRAVGGYNPKLLRTEDDDINARLRDAGLRIRLDPAIRSRYLCRDTIPAIWRQYAGYGYWKVALATIRPSALRVRHLIPAVIVIVLAVAMVTAVAGLWIPLAVMLTIYRVAALGFPFWAEPRSLVDVMLFPVVTATMHFAYGVGTLFALPRWRALRERVGGAVTRADA